MMTNTRHFAEKYIIRLTCQDCMAYLIWDEVDNPAIIGRYIFNIVNKVTNNFITLARLG